MPGPGKPKTVRQAAEQVAATLHRAGHQALLAGGCVRDLLMAEAGTVREPADYDVATDAAPERVCALFPRTLQVGAQFGVVIVLAGRFQVEVATFRSESGYADARHPDQVRFSDARQDALRRDFTINGMFLDPRTGEVLDYVGGREDLRARRVRAIGEPADRFAEDHLRMLRAVRFACVLDFALEERTSDAIRHLAGGIVKVSAERIWQEWEKVLASPNRARGLELAEQTGLLAALWPELAGGAEKINQRLAALEAEADAVTALACQFLDLPPGQADECCRKLAMDNRRRSAVVWLIRHAGDLPTGPQDRVSLKKLMADENWSRLVTLSKATAKTQAGGSPALEANLRAAEAIPPTRIAPPPLIDGRDVMALGVAEGPLVGRILLQVYDEQLAETLVTRQQALARAKELRNEQGV